MQLKRVFVTVALVALVFGSLLSFPVHLHWMALIWVALSLIALGRNRPAWPWLIGCALIMAIQRPGLTLESPCEQCLAHDLARVRLAGAIRAGLGSV